MPSGSPPHHPYRVTRRADLTGPPLTAAQQQVLATLTHLCPKPGSDCDARAVAKSAGMRLGGVVVVLQSLVEKRLVMRMDDEDTSFWTPTLTGRARVRFRAAGTGQAARRAVTDGVV
jgi:DNA-binding MarR family transcriptional regulator